MKELKNNSTTGLLMANSLGFWTDQEIKTDLHFNLWKIPYKRKKDEEHKYFLDIGILLKKENLNDDLRLKIFIPFHFENKDFHDLSRIMIKDDHLLNATFNRPLTYNDESIENHFLIVDGENQKHSFYIQLLKDIQIKKWERPYTEIEFKVDKSKLKEKDIYIRFRLDLLNEKFSTYVQDNDYLLKTAYKKEELVEFRINELRNLSKEIQDFLAEKVNHIKITQIHYFLVRSNDANLVLSHKSFKRCRSVEHDIWQGYIDDKNCNLKDNKSILSYHWHEINKNPEQDILHYGAFAKFSYTRTDRFKIYIFIFILVSIILELIANGLYDLITGQKNVIIDVFTIFVMLLLLIPNLYFILKFGYNTIKLILSFFKFIICCPNDKGDENDN